jgi:hypothetical protein
MEELTLQPVEPSPVQIVCLDNPLASQLAIPVQFVINGSIIVRCTYAVDFYKLSSRETRTRRLPDSL